MHIETITYTDYNGNERTEAFYFNLTKKELTDMHFSAKGGLDQYIARIANEHDERALTKLFQEIIEKAYGKKSDDGRRFMKSEEILKEFTETEAYSELYMRLASDDEEAAKFVNALIPADLAAQVAKEGAPQLTAGPSATPKKPDITEGMEVSHL